MHVQAHDAPVTPEQKGSPVIDRVGGGREGEEGQRGRGREREGERGRGRERGGKGGDRRERE